MSTASTRRARKRQRTAARQQTKGEPRVVRPEDMLHAGAETGFEISERAWLIASACVLVAAAVLRLVALNMKPMHHDEGVNGFFLMNLMRQGVYHYDPSNYHGPTLYFLTLPLAFVADKLHVLDAWVLRLVTVAFGVGTVWLVLALRRYVGAMGALAGAALVAVSPACVFYSRYFIHEALFVFFTLGIVVAALRFYETGAATYLLLASASAAMLFATKETAFISVGTLLLAWLVAFVWVRLNGGGRARGRAGGGLASFASGGDALIVVACALALFMFLWMLFYSSFFTYSKGVFWDSFKAFDIWSKTGMSAFHEKPAHTYVKWLFEEESPILLLASAGTLLALFERRKNRFAVFACAWAFGLLAAYSLISYKTPWLVLSFVVPMCIAGGYFLQGLVRRGRVWTMAACALACAAVAVCLYQTAVLNFFNYDDDSYPYVYSHTRREAVEMVREVERAGARAGVKEPGVSVVSPEYWPLPWYFRDNTHVGYTSTVGSNYDPQTTLVVIGRSSETASEDQSAKLRAVLGSAYVEVGTYALRPGVRLVLFERRDIAGR
ncbi:MAG: flippase activity-associated protein Agl23 [Pyrinomonadaceae bacterium]